MEAKARPNYHNAAVTRVRELGLRLGFGVLIALAAGYATGPTLPAIWLIAVGASQGINAWSGMAAVRDPDYAPSPAWEARYLALTFLNSSVFASIGPLLWFRAGMEGRLIALVILMGGLLNVGTQPDTKGRLLWCGAIPYIVVLGALPMVTLAVEPQASRVEMIFLDLGAMLYLLHIFRAVRRREESARDLASALGRAEKASQAKSNFVATMSHEIRTPLNGILGMAQLMGREPMAAVQVERLNLIKRSGEVLLTLLNDVLDISKIEAAKLELEVGVVDFEEIVHDAQAVFSSLARDKDIVLEISLGASATGAWRGDPLRIRQVFHNLLSNAVKFTEKGLVRGRIDADGDEVVISVVDTGVGLDEQQLALVFEPFVQADATTTRRYGGSGLGLAITRDLVALMGGRIEAKGNLDAGSEFVARLPLIRIADARPDREEEAGLEPCDLRGARILVAEDNDTNQLVIVTLLDQLGMVTRIACNGHEAVKAWEEEPWDLVLMDIQMPVMDGLEATRQIRALERDRQRSRTPILALTANAMTHHVADYELADMDGVAVKPIKFEALAASIFTVIGPRQVGGSGSARL